PHRARPQPAISLLLHHPPARDRSRVSGVDRCGLREREDRHPPVVPRLPRAPGRTPPQPRPRGLGQPEGFLAEEGAVPVLADAVDEGVHLTVLAAQRLVLAVERSPLPLDVQREVVGGRRGRGLIGHHHLVGIDGGQECLAPLRRMRGVQQSGTVRARFLIGGGRPLADSDVVDVPGHPLGPEGQHRVRLYVPHDLHEATDGLVRGNISATAIGIVEPDVLAHTEDGETRLELLLTDGRQRVEGPSVFVERPQLAARGRDAHDPVPGIDGRGHDPRGEIRLVVGMGPHTEDRPQLRGIAVRHGVYDASDASDAAAWDDATKRSRVDAAAPESIDSWAAATPSASEWATLATNNAAPAFRTTMSRWGPALPSTMSRTRAAFAAGSPPSRSSLATGWRPRAAGCTS